MTRYPLKLVPGLLSDDTSFSTKGAWRTADKIRFWRGQPQIIGGWQSLAISQLTGVCRTIYPWTDLLDVLNVAFGTNSNLQLFSQGSLYDITPATEFTPGQVDDTGSPGFGTGAYGANVYGNSAAIASFAMTWSLSSYGQTLIANPRGQTIFEWQNNPNAVATPVPNAPASVAYALVTPSRQILAFGCNEVSSGNFNPLCIRGSDIEDITDWTPTSTNNSFEVVIEGTGGRIVGARLIGTAIYVWTDNDLFIGTLTGSTNQPYSFTLVDSHCGLIGPNAAVVLGQTAYWLAPDLQFRTSELGAQATVVPCPIRDDFAENMAQLQGEKVVISTCAQFDELRMDYPDLRDGVENSRYLVSSLEGYWSRGIMSRTAYVDAGPAAYPISATADGSTYYQEIGESANGGPISWSLQSADQYLGNADTTLSFMGIWPDFTDQAGPFQLTLYVRLYPQSVERVKGPFNLTPGQHKRDFRATGRIVRMGFSGYSSPAAGRIGLPTFDAVAEGLR